QRELGPQDRSPPRALAVHKSPPLRPAGAHQRVESTPSRPGSPPRHAIGAAAGTRGPTCHGGARQPPRQTGDRLPLVAHPTSLQRTSCAPVHNDFVIRAWLAQRFWSVAACKYLTGDSGAAVEHSVAGKNNPIALPSPRRRARHSQRLLAPTL